MTLVTSASRENQEEAGPVASCPCGGALQTQLRCGTAHRLKEFQGTQDFSTLDYIRNSTDTRQGFSPALAEITQNSFNTRELLSLWKLLPNFNSLRDVISSECL